MTLPYPTPEWKKIHVFGEGTEKLGQLLKINCSLIMSNLMVQGNGVMFPRKQVIRRGMGYWFFFFFCAFLEYS